MKVKNSAIIYTGYDYQTLQGVKLLAEWLHSPTQYDRVAFEADMDSNETPEGIDDIVCERPDGVRDYWQVKFTPSPEKDENRLTWEWLLKISGKTARSRSILKKLYDAISAVSAEKLGDVILLTNKRPDRSMESCLLGSKIDFSQIDDNSQLEITRQLGNKEAAIFLFSKLTVQHSDGDYLAIKRSLRAELLKFSDDTGVERLVARAREWAMFKDNPPEQGWIYLHHVREVLSPKRPEPIPEIFSVPEDYCLPDSDFHKHLLAQINRSNGEVITLTGKPGVGKSTYLSYLCQKLEEHGVPLMRHHYFLSLGDATEDRLSPRVVAESLLHQINSFHKESNANTSQPENLRDALITCANYYKGKGKPFVVLIDGLDHVWRDNAKNKKPLDETFRQLLPATDNLVVLVGTQPVDNELLPCTLLTHSPKNEWHWLPEMSGNSIYEFLKLHIESGRLYLNCHENQVDEEIQNSAGALLEITNGYPLHVIYSSEYLSHHGLALSSWQIEKLPPCSDGNITTYYSELWRNLNFTPFVCMAHDNNRFEYYQGKDVPLLYNTLLEKEERRTGIPFTDYFQSEWNSTFEYQPSTATNVDYFFSGDRYRSTGQFYTQASHRGRSAYLRTIELAKEFFGMPDSYARHLSIPALPIEPAYIELRPQKPKWLPVWSGNDSPNEDNLISYVKEGLSNFSQTDDSNDLLAFSLPIKIDDNNWIDLTVAKVNTEIELTPDMQIIERSGCLSIGNLLDKELSYEFGESQMPRVPTLAGTSYPVMRYGHWHSDLESRGFYIPKCPIDNKKIVGSSSDGLFSYSIDGSQVGFSSACWVENQNDRSTNAWIIVKHNEKALLGCHPYNEEKRKY
ncbi:ATP-binding protein [Escherichia coli]|nr:ATP-binding protein [Escherichia coli]